MEQEQYICSEHHMKTLLHSNIDHFQTKSAGVNSVRSKEILIEQFITKDFLYWQSAPALKYPHNFSTIKNK